MLLYELLENYFVIFLQRFDFRIAAMGILAFLAFGNARTGPRAVSIHLNKAETLRLHCALIVVIGKYLESWGFERRAQEQGWKKMSGGKMLWGNQLQL